MNAKEYSQMVDQSSKKSPLLRDVLAAYGVGGLICVFGQLLFEWYSSLGMKEIDARTLVSVTLIFAAAVLTGFGIFDKIAKFAGAGTLVPITGFANAVVSPAIEFKPEGYVLGVAAKMFTIAGPVIVYGTLASVVYGIIYWIMRMI